MEAVWLIIGIGAACTLVWMVRVINIKEKVDTHCPDCGMEYNDVDKHFQYCSHCSELFN